MFSSDARDLTKDNIEPSAGRYTGSYRIPVFIFLMISIFKIPQYWCHLNGVQNATLLERGLFLLLHFGEDTAVCVTKAWNTLHDFCPDFPLILQSEQVEESQSRSADYSWQITQKISSCIMVTNADFFSFRLWFYPVGGDQTCLIFSADFSTHMFSLVMRLLATRCSFLREFVVIGTTLKSRSVWFSIRVWWPVFLCHFLQSR